MIVLIYSLDGNQILIRMNILLMTSDVFLHIGRSILRSFLTVIFYTFIFVKNKMHVDFFLFFYITKGTLIFALAWHVGSAWA